MKMAETLRSKNVGFGDVIVMNHGQASGNNVHASRSGDILNRVNDDDSRHGFSNFHRNFGSQGFNNDNAHNNEHIENLRKERLNQAERRESYLEKLHRQNMNNVNLESNEMKRANEDESNSLEKYEDIEEGLQDPSHSVASNEVENYENDAVTDDRENHGNDEPKMGLTHCPKSMDVLTSILCQPEEIANQVTTSMMRDDLNRMFPHRQNSINSMAETGNTTNCTSYTLSSHPDYGRQSSERMTENNAVANTFMNTFSQYSNDTQYQDYTSKHEIPLTDGNAHSASSGHSHTRTHSNTSALTSHSNLSRSRGDISVSSPGFIPRHVEGIENEVGYNYNTIPDSEYQNGHGFVKQEGRFDSQDLDMSTHPAEANFSNMLPGSYGTVRHLQANQVNPFNPRLATSRKLVRKRKRNAPRQETNKRSKQNLLDEGFFEQTRISGIPVYRHEDRNRTKRWLCFECGKSFRGKSEVIVHIRVHTGEKPLKCKYCEKRFAHPSNVKVHERSHRGERPYRCEVPHCGKTFAHSVSLKEHVRKHRADLTGFTDQSLSFPA